MGRDTLRILRLILGDQLNSQHSWFSKQSSNIDYLLIESLDEAKYTTHHIQKLVGFLTAMREFADELSKCGHNVMYVEYLNPDNKKSISKTIDHFLKSGKYSNWEYQEPDEYRLDEDLSQLKKKWQSKVPGIMVSSEHFYTERYELREFFKGKHYVQESFYRYLRKKHGVLVQDGGPTGGQWNFDADNRKKYDGKIPIPKRTLPYKDLSKVYESLPKSIKTIGRINPKVFQWPTNRKESLKHLQFFLDRALPNFGTYQDAMQIEEKVLFHSLLSFSLNTKQISPSEVVDGALETYKRNPKINLSSLEGFIRQILGWREYMRGVYWSEMPGYTQKNFFEHQEDLPQWFWTGDTKMECQKQAIGQSLDFSYAHHIQRLMITGNFCLLMGVDPDQVDEWYLGIYIDAVQWVEITNTRGMSQYADGGLLATKPYVSSANYISKMSNYCSNCYYKKEEKVGDKACPYNSLYWYFFEKNRSKLEKNQRIGMVYPQLNKMDKETKKSIFKKADELWKKRHEL